MPVTALIPFAAFPLTGVLDHREVAHSYGHTLVLLMLAGSMVGTALERSGAHRRLALGMARAVGGKSAPRLVLGFLLASAILSMWISNTATVVMLMPVVLAVLNYHKEEGARLAIPLLLAIAYGGAIGGTATPIGTPPNLIFLSHYELATGREISFAGWVRIGLPAVLVMLPIVWLWLSRRIKDVRPPSLPELGSWRSDERRVVAVFALAALAWMTRSEPFGGWGTALGVSDTAGDSTVGLAAVVIMFLIPRGKDGDGALLDWETAVRIPWGVFIMIGGGMAIGQAFQSSGLGQLLGEALVPLTDQPAWMMVGLVALSSTFITEITSNTAVANVMMPVLAAVGVASGIDPIWLMVPATLGLNWAFMLPVATASNAFVYGTGRITTTEMAREGFALNLAGCVVITVISMLVLG
jgi:sodium-dependent dicarboxylate transporter 2/3/5